MAPYALYARDNSSSSNSTDSSSSSDTSSDSSVSSFMDAHGKQVYSMSVLYTVKDTADAMSIILL